MFNWKKEETAQNAIYLDKEMGGKGRQFKSRFLVPGLVKYDYGVCLLTKENADKFIQDFVGCPVIINHQDVTDENAKEISVGNIFSVWFDEKDGYYWCNGIITDKDAIKLIDKGYSVSCQYTITEYSDNNSGALHNGNPYDKIIENGRPEHLAIVNNPRYEGAIIAVNAINNSEKKEELEDDIKETDNTASNSFEEEFKDTLYEVLAEGIVNRLGELIASNEDREPDSWITIRGNRIPVFGDKKETAEKFIDEKSAGFSNMSGKDIEESRKQTNSFSSKERESIKTYTDDLAFRTINKYLRNEIEENEIKPEHKQTIENIDKALKKCSLPNDAMLYRGVRSDFIEKVFGNQEIADLIGDVFDEEPKEEDVLKVQDALLGKPFKDTGFTSTSYARDKAFDHQPLMLEINAPKGINAAAVDKLSKSRDKEGEILINRDYNYVIKKISLKKNKDGRTHWNFIVDLVP